MIEEQPSTRRRSLDATSTIVRERGLRAATCRRVTNEAKANLGAISYHFRLEGVARHHRVLERLRTDFCSTMPAC